MCEKDDFSPIIVSISLGVSTKNVLSDEMSTVIKNTEDIMYKRKLVEGKNNRSPIITSLRKSLLERSCETPEHINKMLHIANMFGEELHLTQTEMDELNLLSWSHDMGKIGVPDSILNKPDKLTFDEWCEVKKHSEIGHRIAKSIPELSLIADYILTHHEHWDGNGYPQDLIGDKIPKLPRIISIIDAYVAMTSRSPYREPMSKEDAIMEIKRCPDTQFDPNLVDVFMQMKLNL